MAFGEESELRSNLRQFAGDEGTDALTEKVGDWIPVLEELHEIVSPTDAKHLRRILDMIKSCYVEITGN